MRSLDLYSEVKSFKRYLIPPHWTFSGEQYP